MQLYFLCDAIGGQGNCLIHLIVHFGFISSLQPVIFSGWKLILLGVWLSFELMFKLLNADWSEKLRSQVRENRNTFNLIVRYGWLIFIYISIV